MKKINFLIAFAISSIGFSQTILNQSEATSRTVQDPQTVIMLPGFQANSTIVNPFVAKIGDNGEGSGSVDSGAGATNPSGTVGSNSFHDTQGNIEVNGGGQLQFSLPIALPPGVKSVAPQVNLIYTSGSGNGIAGYGWNISGITAISRMGKTIEKDGEVKGIQLDYSDYYSFNGQRLILKSGTYGTDGAEYVTEKYSNVKIKSIGAITGQVWQGPEYWEVTFEDGSQAWYGATATGASNARTPIEYNIVKWKDAQGNYITYTYTQENNVAVINDIQWGGNETLSKAHFNQIVFNYVTRDLRESSYVNGVKFVQTNLVTNLVVNTNGNQFKKYVVDYNKDSNGTNYQFVNKVTEYNSINEASNPVKFDYEDTSYGSWKYDYKPTTSGTKLHGDFNGDGKIDVIRYLDSFEECAKWETVMIPETVTDPSGNTTTTYYKEKQCTGGFTQMPAGLYLYRSTFDSKPDKKIYSGTLDLTKSDLENATAITYKRNDNYVIPKQGFAIWKKLTTAQNSDVELKIYSIDNDSILRKDYSYVIPYNSFKSPTEVDGTDVVSSVTSISSISEIDVDGNGLSEIVLGLKETRRVYDYEINKPLPHNYANTLIVNTVTGQSTVLLPYWGETDLIGKGKVGDFNGDGKTDIFVISDADNLYKPILYEFGYNNSTGQYTYTSYQYGVNSPTGVAMAAVTGDFNGDGKTDLMIPTGYSSFDWKLYTSTGKGFEEQLFTNLAFYNTNTEDRNDSDGYVYNYARQYYAQDVNKDGKSDFITFYSKVYADSDGDENSSFILDVYENKGINNSNLISFSKKSLVNYTISSFNLWGQTDYKGYPFNYKIDGTWYFTKPEASATSNLREHYSPVLGNFRINSSDETVLVFHSSSMAKYSYYDISKESKVNSIIQGGLKTEIDYKELDPVVNVGLYAPVKKEQFPYLEMDRVSQSFSVSQLRQIIDNNDNSKTRKQDFLYRGFIAHLQGRGMVGFRQTARSSWYATGFENTKVWSGVEIDPLNEGIPIKEWSIKTNDINQVFPSDISTNNNSLLSVKLNTVNTTTLVNGVKVILPATTTTKDFQKDITSVNTIEYGSYYLPSKTISNINNSFAISTTELKYIHNINGVGKDYYVGRPESKTELMQVYGDSKGAKEEYTYENNLLKTSKTYNRDNTGWLQDTYLYDGFGNITEKKSSNSVDSKTKTARTTYEDKGRFVIKKTDVDFNLETNITYNNWGQVLTQTDPLGIIVTNEYDNWGKLLKSKTNLGGTTTYTYEKASNGDAVVNQYSPDGNQKITYTNKLGQNYKSSTKGFTNNTFISQQTQYDVLGRKIKESEPYLDGVDTPKWNTIEYDDYSRPIKATSYTGKIVETSYNGRTATITEKNTKQSYTNVPASGINDKFKTQVADAVGNIISTTDIGGTIEFKYNAAGENTEAKYGTNVVTNKYDSWGRKIEFNDPSNGLYKYEYNDGFGALTKEISPKGYKEYIFNNLGQLITQKEVSNDSVSTNKLINVVYNAKGAIIKKHGTANGKPYSSYVNYDAYGRVLSSGEESNGKYFMQKGITYDDKSRITSYEKSLLSSNILTKTTIENVYDTWSGTLSQVKDKTSGKLLWQLEQANAKGQVLKAKLGGTSIENTYDSNNFLSNVLHKNTTTNTTVLQLGYSFNAVRNELNSRTRGGDFTIIETFAYDDNNRLVNWTNPVTGTLSNNLYDAQGRIRENDQVGVIKYDNPAKIYQATGMTLNAVGTNNYNNNLIQSIAYNENNDPIYIDGEKGDVRFTYGLTDMRQMATYGGNFDPDSEGKFTKYYSEDGSYEIIKNNQTGQEKHILYIGGTPYDANIVYLKDFAEAQAKYVFMHKDYLGSILAISDEAGNAIEQRHFDAWGNFTHLKIGNNATIIGVDAVKNYLQNNSLIIDRGYTSHEHFNEVGIIHMNGRLYDPLLRRFLNADENIQDPNNTQNYNKYGYVLNNPLMYNDPSGEFLAFLGLWVFWKAVIIGAAVGLASYTVGLAVTGNLDKWSLGGAIKATFFGALGGAVTFGIGSIFSSASGAKDIIGGLTKVGKFLKSRDILWLAQGLAHGASQGVLAAVQGGDFWQGAAGGFFGSLGASTFGAVAGDFSAKAGGQILFGALSGGVGAELSGGNFWQGAVTGSIVAGLNHAMHQISKPGIKVDRETRRQFRALRRAGDYQGAFDLVNSKYNLDADIKGKYTLTFSDDDGYSGLTGGDAYATQEVTIAKHVFRNPVAVFARVVHHEFVHVYQRAVLGMTGNLSIYQVREFLAYHDTLFNNSLPKASFGSMEGYWSKAREFYNYMTANPTLRSAYQSQYNDFANSSYFSR